MLILGINAYHADSSACLLDDGRIVAAVEEERFRRVKHWAGLPTEAVRFCLSEASATLSDIHCIAINQDTRANWLRRAKFVATGGASPSAVLNRIRNRSRRASVTELLERDHPGQSFRGEFRRVEHHLAHLASTFLLSPFDEAAVVSIDGFGDFASTAWGHGQDGTLAIAGRVYFPHSLGVFYEAMTQHLGFWNYGDEYKVMGLAPYGELEFVAALRDVIRLQADGSFQLNLQYFQHHRTIVTTGWDNASPTSAALGSPELEAILGPARKAGEPLTDRHRAIARSVQQVYEDACFHVLNHVQKHTGSEALTLSGGCAMNSVANGKVYARTPFKRMYVQPAAGDAGGALGAALIAWHEKAGTVGSAANRAVMSHAYWGPSYSSEAVGAVLREASAELGRQGCVVTQLDDVDALYRETARSIANGAVVGWFQGRMEWGPRALGNRSILGDPRRADMKEILNSKIKRRESFRPFAPSILRDAVADWFETDDDVPFMTQVYQVREARRQQIPAVTHVDGSGRLQTVTKEANPSYHGLISAFADLTGVPIVLNTSFNENEPIVCTPSEALDCFLRTRMDLLVLGTWCVSRQAS